MKKFQVILTLGTVFLCKATLQVMEHADNTSIPKFATPDKTNKGFYTGFRSYYFVPERSIPINGNICILAPKAFLSEEPTLNGGLPLQYVKKWTAQGLISDTDGNITYFSGSQAAELASGGFTQERLWQPAKGEIRIYEAIPKQSVMEAKAKEKQEKKAAKAKEKQEKKAAKAKEKQENVSEEVSADAQLKK